MSAVGAGGDRGVFYELRSDIEVIYGGVWFDPVDNSAIEVIDMEVATGEEGMGITLIEEGPIYINEERLKKAAESAGLFHEERPPQPPTGRKHWLPRPWEPPPKPEHLFWMPEPIPGPKVMKAWGEWNELNNEGVKFEELPEDMRNYILMGVDAIMSYYGMDGGPSRSVAVIEYGLGMKQKKEKWGENSVITKNPERAVWKILAEMGVRRDA